MCMHVCGFRSLKICLLLRLRARENVTLKSISPCHRIFHSVVCVCACCVCVCVSAHACTCMMCVSMYVISTSGLFMHNIICVHTECIHTCESIGMSDCKDCTRVKLKQSHHHLCIRSSLCTLSDILYTLMAASVSIASGIFLG